MNNGAGLSRSLCAAGLIAPGSASGNRQGEALFRWETVAGRLASLIAIMV